ncbi:MAG: RdgB/HAM1 family non-canonical purine NTP pyrophosphatase [Candidatus Pacebacteria bacterium]|nr:RdgB/HAM1 family non-canonical purine NTP pyrophosphatase [Candidatus Paceibacterota bacterium]
MLLITGNKNKVREFEEILDCKIDSQSLNIEEIQEVLVEKVSENKVRKAYEILKKPVLVEDTGLIFEELHGLPGALIKWFEEKLSYEEICNLIKENRNATSKICVSYFDGKDLKQFIGEVKGKIADFPKGENGFGWDKIFIPEGYDKTFAEMDSNQKNSLSMRKIALEKLKKELWK